MKRSVELELRRAVRLERRMARHVAEAFDGYAYWRMIDALRGAEKDPGLSEAAKTFLGATASKVMAARGAREEADREYERLVGSLAQLLGVV